MTSASLPPRNSFNGRLLAIAERLQQLASEVSEFWIQRGPDRKHGGFLGSLDRDGNAAAPTTKGLIQQARHLWTWSMWYRERESTARIRELADSTYRFIVDHLRAADGDEFIYRVSESG